VRNPCPEFFGGISFLDSDRGFLLCGSQPATIEMAKTLYETSDGGDTWRIREQSRFLNPHRRGGGDIPMQGGVGGILFRTDRDGLMATGRVGLYATHDGGHRWRLPLVAGDYAPESLSWPSPRRIFAVLWQVGLIRSDDGGRHWRQLFPAGPRPERAVSPSSALDAIAAGRAGLFRAQGAILATTDGGATWRQRSRLRGTAMQQLVRVSRREVWALGPVLRSRGAPGPFRVFRSLDDGRTWTKIRMPVRAGFATLSVPVSGTAFLAVDDRTLYRTTDAGRTWQRVGRGRELRNPMFVSASDGFRLLGEHTLLRTTDAGHTWKPVRVEARLRMFALAAAGPTHWWIQGNVCGPLNAKGASETPCRGRLLRTSDAGRHWELIRLPSMPGIGIFSFVNGQVGWAGDPWAGPYRTVDGGRTWKLVYADLERS